MKVTMPDPSDTIKCEAEDQSDDRTYKKKSRMIHINMSLCRTTSVTVGWRASILLPLEAPHRSTVYSCFYNNYQLFTDEIQVCSEIQIVRDPSTRALGVSSGS
ncbi:unnamed protein product [Amoebophrya sp. A25]|nr:unnamed protein product [Amoebophrya sp. A25]|eukprot:GSA25T00018851001.1